MSICTYHTIRCISNSSNSSCFVRLVELIVVLVILAILAALLIPALTGYIDKAKQKQITSKDSIMDLLSTSIGFTVTIHSRFPWIRRVTAWGSGHCLPGPQRNDALTVTDMDTAGP